MTTRPSGLQLSASVFAMENNQDLRVSKSGTHIHRCFLKKKYKWLSNFKSEIALLKKATV